MKFFSSKNDKSKGTVCRGVHGATDASLREVGLDGRTAEEAANAEYYESHWPTLQKWLATPNQTERCPLIKCGVCFDEILLKEGTFSLHVPQEPGCSCGVTAPAQQPAWHRTVPPADPNGRATVTTIHLCNPLPLTGRETDNSVWLGCCGNLIGLRCLLAMTRDAASPEKYRNAIKCPFCRKCLLRERVMLIKDRVSAQGLCVLCQDFFAEPSGADKDGNTWVTQFGGAGDSSGEERKKVKKGDVYKLTNCKHSFCTGCLAGWTADIDVYGHHVCPICSVGLRKTEIKALKNYKKSA